MAKKRGSNSRDTLNGTSSNDRLFGLGGNDVLNGRAGVDFIDGGPGNDIIRGGTGNDRLFGKAGNDRIAGNDGDDHIDGGTGDDVLEGNAGNDIIEGGDGFDTIEGGDGDDDLNGNSGSDTVSGGAGDDIVRGGPDFTFSINEINILKDGTGFDQVFGSSYIDSIRLTADSTADAINGRDGNDTISYSGDAASSNVGVEVYLNAPGINLGAAAGDTFINVENIDGMNGEDNLTIGRGGAARGGSGNDVLQSHGVDGFRELLIGDAGNDTLQAQDFNSDGITFRLQNGFGDDTIVGFKRSAGDLLQVSNRSFDGDRFGIGFLTVNNQTDNVAVTALPQFIFETDTDILWFDFDGSGVSSAPVKIATLPAFFATYGNMLTSDFEFQIA